jgi:hypothetical protein
MGIISPALYEVDRLNNVTFVGVVPTGDASDELYRAFKAPETVTGNAADSDLSRSPLSTQSDASQKRDVFSLGLLLYYLLNREVYLVNRQTGIFPLIKSRKRPVDACAIMAEDSGAIPRLMQRMTAYEAELRPLLKEVLSVLHSNICRFSIISENMQTGERYTKITRSFTGSESYKFVPDKEYIYNSVTITPVSCEPLSVPFRLVHKQYILEVIYGGEGRWLNTERKVDTGSIQAVSREQARTVPKSTAALHFCDEVYLIKGDSLFIETDGYTYEMGLYEYRRDDECKQITLIRDGSIAVPERLEARILSILREREKAINDLYCVAVYSGQGELSAEVIKSLNDMLPEAIRIYQLSDDDILKGSAIYLSKEEITHEI